MSPSRSSSRIRYPARVACSRTNPILEPVWRVHSRGAFGMLVLGLLGVMAARFALARNEPVFTQTRQYSPTTGDTGAFVTRAFTLAGHRSNVELRIETDLSNASAYFNLALLAEDGGTGYDFGREVSNYAGVEDGESWHEGSARATR